MSSEGEKCLFSPCHASGALQTFKTVAVQKMVATSKVKHDELHKTLSGSYILGHKSCYCSYTSRSRKNEQGKRMSTLTDTDVSKRLKPHGEVDGEEKNKHMEEGEGRRRLDEAERKKITVELEKYSYPPQ